MTLALFVLIQYQSVTDRRTDRQTERRTDISLLQYQHGLLCYHAGKNSCLSLSFLGPSPDSLPGLCFWIPLGDFCPRDSFASPNFKSWIRPWTWCRVFHSRVFHPCNSDGAMFSTPAFSVNPILATLCCPCHGVTVHLHILCCLEFLGWTVAPWFCFSLYS